MNVSGSSAQGPTTATFCGSGRWSPLIGSAVPASSRTTERSATSRASSRLAAESRSTSAALATDASGVHPASSRPSCALARSARRAARSTSASSRAPERTSSTSPSPYPSVSGSSTSMPASRASAPASAWPGGDPVHGGQERDRPVVGDHRALEAPLVAQHLGEQPGVGTGRDAVDVGVGVHHRADPTDRDGRLERGQDDVAQLARPHRHRPVVAGGTRGGVAGEVLEGRDHAGGLESLHVGGAQHGHEVGVLADRLLDPTPPVVTHDVEHGRESLVHAEGGHVAADRRGHPAHQLGVPGRAPRDGGGVDRGAVRREAGQALLVHEGGDAEPGVLDDDALLVDQLVGALGHGDRLAAVDPGEVPETVPARLGQRHRPRRGEHVLHRRDLQVAALDAGLAGQVVAHPAAAQLADLLLQRHRREEQLDPLGQRAGLVLPRPVGLGCRTAGSRVLLKVGRRPQRCRKKFRHGPNEQGRRRGTVPPLAAAWKCSSGISRSAALDHVNENVCM